MGHNDAFPENTREKVDMCVHTHVGACVYGSVRMLSSQSRVRGPLVCRIPLSGAL